MWRKGNPLTLLVGMQICTATVENSMEFALKTKNRATRNLQSHSLAYIYTENHN